RRARVDRFELEPHARGRERGECGGGGESGGGGPGRGRDGRDRARGGGARLRRRGSDGVERGAVGRVRGDERHRDEPPPRRHRAARAGSGPEDQRVGKRAFQPAAPLLAAPLRGLIVFLTIAEIVYKIPTSGFLSAI